jgi:hypothetical protein
VWQREAHVALAASTAADRGAPTRLAVGGTSGAVFVSLYVERRLPGLRTAICGRCWTTWRVGKGWRPTHLIGERRPLCEACKNTDRQQRHRTRPGGDP